MFGCDCGVCTSAAPRDTRFRTSTLVRRDDLSILIDTSPELRRQARANGVDSIGAVLFTHATREEWRI